MAHIEQAILKQAIKDMKIAERNLKIARQNEDKMAARVIDEIFTLTAEGDAEAIAMQESFHDEIKMSMECEGVASLTARYISDMIVLDKIPHIKTIWSK